MSNLKSQSLARSLSPGTTGKPEFMSWVAGGITQPRPRRVLRFCILFACIGLIIAIICLGALVTMLTDLWWVYLLGFVSSIPPVLFSFASASNGRFGYIVGISLSSLANVSTSIGVVCAVMTVNQLSTYIYQACILEPHHTSPNFKVDCSQYSTDEFDFYTYIFNHRVFFMAFVLLYGVFCTVLAGITMVYSFFLARRVKRQGPSWLKIPQRFSLPSISGLNQRSLSFGNISAAAKV